MKQKIFWLAGEHSADLHSSLVIRQMQKVYPEILHYGVGGKNMTNVGFQSLFPFEKFCVMGFLEVAKQAAFFLKIEQKIVRFIKQEKPDLVILVDYPGLNMRVAEKVARLGIKILYFISPQFWAWKYHRIFSLKKFTTHICYILPFEKKYFEKENVPASYVGHPIAEEIQTKLSKEKFAEKYNLSLSKKWIGFFPGSRHSEIKKLLPIYAETIKKIDAEKEILISQASSINDRDFFEHSLPENVKIISDYNYEMMKYCDFLVVKSGTSTLECAYSGTPFVIVYKTSRISYEIGKNLVKIKRIGLPNIVLDEDAIPELVQHDVNPQNINYYIDKYTSDSASYQTMKKKLNRLQAILGSKKTSHEVTKIIIGLLDE